MKKTDSAKRVALYARISTNDDQQDLENQLAQLRTWAGQMGWTVAGEYTDTITGAAEKRPGLEALMGGAAVRHFDIVAVWKLDRLTRGGPARAFAYIARLTANKVEFWSMTEEYFRTVGPTGELMIAIAAHIAEMERTTIRHRVRAGIEKARKNGVRFGRPARVLNLETIQQLRDQGKSIRQIAAEMDVPKSAIERRLK